MIRAQEKKNSQYFPLFFPLYRFAHKYNRIFEAFHSSLEETDTEDSTSTLSEFGSLNVEFGTMDLDFDNSDKEVSDHAHIVDEIDSHTWDEIETESDAEFLADHGLIEDVISTSEVKAINPIDRYRHFIMDEIIHVMVRGTNRYAQQYLKSHTIST